jgi:hypothetical protein
VEQELLTLPEHMSSPEFTWWVGKRMVNYYIWHHGALFFVSKPNSIIEEMVEYNKRSQRFYIKSKNQSQKCHHRKNNQVVQER